MQKVSYVEKLNYPFLRRLAESGRPRKDIVADVLGLAISSSVSFAKGVYPLIVVGP